MSAETQTEGRPVAGKVMINPYVRVTYCGSNEILVKHGARSRFSQVIRDDGRTKLLGRMLRNLKEPASLEELQGRGIVREAETDDAARLIQFLYGERILIAPDQYLPHVYLSMQFGPEGIERLASRTVGLLGSGFLGSRIARDLLRLRVKGLALLDGREVETRDRDYFDFAPALVTPGRSFADLVRQALDGDRSREAMVIDGALTDAAAIRQLFERSDFVIAALEWFSPATLHAANAAALEAGKPWMSVYIDGSEALIGPVYVPGETLCYNEFEIQNEASSRLQMDYLIYKETIAEDGLDARHLALPPFVSVVQGWASTAALSFLSSSQSFLVGRCVRVDFERFSVDYQDVLKLPRCPACTSVRPAYRHTFL